jgi:hypothetical protein
MRPSFYALHRRLQAVRLGLYAFSVMVSHNVVYEDFAGIGV